MIALLLAAVLVGALGLTLGTLPASAHSELVSSNPADGATGAGRPAEVTLTFNENIADTGLQVVAMGADGAVALGTPSAAGPNVTAAWPADAPDGRYQVSYRVVSADGHPIDGSISFTYGDAARGASAPAAESEVSAAAASPDPAAAATPASATTGGEDESSGFPLWIPAVVVVVGVAIGAAIARAMRSRA